MPFTKQQILSSHITGSEDPVGLKLTKQELQEEYSNSARGELDKRDTTQLALVTMLSMSEVYIKLLRRS